MSEKPTYEALRKKVRALKEVQAALKKAETALRDSEEKYRITFESITDSITVTRVSDGLYRYVNDGFCHQTGYSRKDVLGRTPSHINLYAYPSERDRFIDILKTHGKAENVEVSFRRKNGEIYYSEFSAKPISYAGEACLLAQSRDITERKRMEEALKKSEEKYRLLIENQNDMVIKFDRDHKLGFVSPSYCKTFGVKENEILGKSFFPLIHEDDIERVISSIASLQMPPHTAYHEERAKTGDGWRWFGWSLKAIVDEGGKIIEIVSVGRDISEKKWAEEALRRSEEKYRQIFETNQAIKLMIDPEDGAIVDANTAACNYYGYPKGEMISLKISDINTLPPEKTYLEMQKAKKEERLYFNFLHRLASGEVRDVEVYAGPVNLGDKTILYSIVHDITERKRLEEEKLKLMERLQQAQKMESIGNLAGGIAHDFNNILFPIVGISELLLEDLPLQSPEHLRVQKILRAAERGSDLVGQILAFSRQSEHQFMPVRVQKILDEVLKLSRSTIPSDIAIHQDIQNNCGMVMADPTQLHQIAMNLITNAYHAVEETGGAISLQLKEKALRIENPEDASLKPGPYAMFTVSDTGCGIDSDVLDKIFDPYFTTKEQGKGTGLGLAVVYGIVKEHSGDIQVHSELGKGSTFDVYLPLMKKSSEAVLVEHAKISPTGTERIMLVDDEESVVQLVKQILERLGYHVIPFTSSVDALSIFKRNPDAFDLVITDMTMPNITGDQLAKNLISIRKDIPIIICTGFSNRIDAEKANHMGIKGFLMKPVSKPDLANLLRKILDDQVNRHVSPPIPFD